MNRVILPLVILAAALAFAPARALPVTDHAACERIGQLDDGRALWAGDCAPVAESLPTDTATAEPTPTSTDTVLPPTDTPEPPTPEPTATEPPAPVAPYPAAPLCESHDNSNFHVLWDSARGCHYDHEHGTNPFAADVAAAFPGFDLQQLLGGVQVGHTNPSSPMENTHKHGGFKWQVDVSAPLGCSVGFEGGTVAVDAYAVQYHAFGPQSVEFESRNHSSAALLRQCVPDNPEDKGYVYTVQLQEYGERCLPYQGQTLIYPDNFAPTWNCGFGPYFTTEGVPLVRPSLAFYNGSAGRNNLSVWSSNPTGAGPRPETPRLFRLLFRARDAYQVIDTLAPLVHPFTWLWVCSADGGLTYNPAGCKYNNSTTTIHEVKGDIPAEWDGLAGFDTDPRPGRVTGDGYTSAFGVLNLACTGPSAGCYPLKLVGAYVGRYSSELTAEKVSNPTPFTAPERDIYFLNGQVANETDAGAVPSGWISDHN